MVKRNRCIQLRDFEWWADMRPCLQDLVELTGGELRLAAMPPRDGELAGIGRIVLAAELANPGDVFWRLVQERYDLELAFLRGALGVVTAGPPIEPWPGRFLLRVDDPVASLRRLAAAVRQTFASAVQPTAAAPQSAVPTSFQKSLPDSSELKVLQLCGPRGADISPPTCERLTVSQLNRRCRRQAA
jgi:hypothetical protein